MKYEFGRGVLPSQRRPVAWYSPPVLLQAARELMSSTDFLRNSDRRESFLGPLKVLDFSEGARRIGGFDFIADTGDGGNATFTLAQAAMAREVRVAGGESHARPGLVVLGGDLAYPGAGSYDYHYRLLEPFAQALSGSDDAAWQEVAAIPQNHDWYDSTTTFCRYFVARNRRTTEFVDTHAQQDRTYFAALLPHRWWILGLDFALKGDIDRRQFRAFCDLWNHKLPGPRIEAADNIILVYPEPYWTRMLSQDAPKGYTLRYQRLEHLLAALPKPEDVEAHGANARIRLRLAGDLHHYCRQYTREGRYAESGAESTHVVTCGTGGAFLHTTHGPEVQSVKIIDTSPEKDTEPDSLGLRIRVGRADGSEAKEHEARTHLSRLDQSVCFPDAKTSRLLALKLLPLSILRSNFSRPRPKTVSKFCAQWWDSNLGFVMVLGLLYGFNAYVNSIAFSASFEADRFQLMHKYSLAPKLFYDWLRAMFFSPFAALVNILMVVGCVRIAWEGDWGWKRKLAGGLTHGLMHACAVCLLYFAASHWAQGWVWLADSGVFYGLVVLLLVMLAGGVVGALLFGLYFACTNGLCGQLTNNASGAIAIQDFKGFLRFRLTDKAMEAMFVACEKVPRKWKIDAKHIVADGAPAVWEIKDRFTLRHRADS